MTDGTAALEAAQIVEHLKMLKINDSGSLGELGWQAAKEIERLLSTAKEADGMREALQRLRDYAWWALEQFKDRRGHLDISGFHMLIEVADAALLPSEGTKT